METLAAEPIGEADLVAYLGKGIASSYIKALRASPGCLVPNYDDLLVGDIVLSRKAARRPHALTSLLPSIESHQRSIERLKTTDAWRWTHSMLYVGRLHVAESQKSFRAIGTTVSPLTKPANIELVVCRRRDRDEIEGFDAYRRNAALYALMDHAVNKRDYGRKRIVAISTDGRGFISKIAGRVFPPDFSKEIICSEFVLEALAIGGKMLTQEWEQLKTPQSFFYPGDFYAHPSFETVPLTYLSLA